MEKLSCQEWLIINNEKYSLQDIPQHKIEIIWRAAQMNVINIKDKSEGIIADKLF